MKAELSIRALYKALGIVNRWPSPNRATGIILDDLAEMLELTDEEKVKANWKPVNLPGGGLNFQFSTLVKVKREITTEQAQTLVAMLEPSENAQWSREDRPLFNEWMGQIGGKLWEKTEKEGQ